MIRRVIIGAAFTVLAQSYTMQAFAATYTYDVVARTGDVAPGFEPYVYYLIDTSMQINDRGEVAFIAEYSQNLEDVRGKAIFRGSPGNITPIIEVGQSIPNSGGLRIWEDTDFFINPIISNAGHVAFHAEVAGHGVTSENRNTIFLEYNGDIQIIARSGETSAVNYDGVLKDVKNPNVNSSGTVVFNASVANDTAVVVRKSDQAEIIFQNGDVIDDSVGSGAYIRSNPQISDSGNIVFTASLQPSGSAGAIVRSNSESGDLEFVVHRGMEMPEVTGATFEFFQSLVAINNEGETAFAANLSGSGINSSNDGAVFKEVDGKLDLVAREGAAIPGMENAYFGAFGATVGLTSDGTVLFSARIRDFPEQDRGSVEGLFIEKNGEIDFLLPFQQRSDGLRIYDILFQRPINNAGQFAFLGNFEGEREGFFIATPEVAPVPLPASLLFALSGLAALLGLRQLRSRSR